MVDDIVISIGDLARRTGMATSALRYYERIGLLTPAERSGQRRLYRESSVERVALIRLYQDAGFTLAEIGQLAATTSEDRPAWIDLAGRKIAELDARIAEAQHAKTLIEHALRCPRSNLLACPSFRAALQARLATTDGGRALRDP